MRAYILSLSLLLAATPAFAGDLSGYTQRIGGLTVARGSVNITLNSLNSYIGSVETAKAKVQGLLDAKNTTDELTKEGLYVEGGGDTATLCTTVSNTMKNIESVAHQGNAKAIQAKGLLDALRSADPTEDSAGKAGQAATLIRDMQQSATAMSKDALNVGKSLDQLSKSIRMTKVNAKKAEIATYNQKLNDLQARLAEATSQVQKFETLRTDALEWMQDNRRNAEKADLPTIDGYITRVNRMTVENNADAPLKHALALLKNATTDVDKLKSDIDFASKSSGPCENYAGARQWLDTVRQAQNEVRGMHDQVSALLRLLILRLNELITTQSTNDQILKTAPAKLEQANKAGDRKGAANIEAIMERAKKRQGFIDQELKSINSAKETATKTEQPVEDDMKLLNTLGGTAGK